MVWLEPWQAARAILERSSRNVAVHPTKNITEGEAMEHEEVAEEPAVSIPTPPGVWRLGLECPHAKALVMRFATRTDRKIKGAERLSHYYRNHGNPNYGGMTGLISSSRKRRFHGKPDPADPVDSKNPWGSLAESWGASEPAEVCGNYMETTASEPAENWEERLEGTKDQVKRTLLYSNSDFEQENAPLELDCLPLWYDVWVTNHPVHLHHDQETQNQKLLMTGTRQTVTRVRVAVAAPTRRLVVAERSAFGCGCMPTRKKKGIERKTFTLDFPNHTKKRTAKRVNHGHQDQSMLDLGLVSMFRRQLHPFLLPTICVNDLVHLSPKVLSIQWFFEVRLYQLTRTRDKFLKMPRLI